jgi:hypothetical protein
VMIYMALKSGWSTMSNGRLHVCIYYLRYREYAQIHIIEVTFRLIKRLTISISIMLNRKTEGRWVHGRYPSIETGLTKKLKNNRDSDQRRYYQRIRDIIFPLGYRCL